MNNNTYDNANGINNTGLQAFDRCNFVINSKEGWLSENNTNSKTTHVQYSIVVFLAYSLSVTQAKNKNFPKDIVHIMVHVCDTEYEFTKLV